MRRRLLSIVVIAVMAVLGAVAPADAAGRSLKSRLANVKVPAYCQMPAQRLHHGKTAAKYLPAQGGIEFDYLAKPKKVHLRRHGTQVIAQYGCTAGGVGWPSYIVLYDRHNRLIASYELGKVYGQEHAQVDSWRAKGHTVRLKWSSYEGAGFDVHHRTSTLRLRGKRLVLR